MQIRTTLLMCVAVLVCCTADVPNTDGLVLLRWLELPATYTDNLEHRVAAGAINESLRYTVLIPAPDTDSPDIVIREAIQEDLDLRHIPEGALASTLVLQHDKIIYSSVILVHPDILDQDYTAVIAHELIHALGLTVHDTTYPSAFSPNLSTFVWTPWLDAVLKQAYPEIIQ